ncbi:hypothetical protein C8Q72DRAFT_787517 [Fomitopsis betulina]|nr:hypothetical protein C8Q72DRAFT_787517 [Fomitopsis betulina]
MDKGHVAVATRSNDTINSVLFHEEPPPLNYTIITAHRKRAIIIWFSLLFVEAGILPLILFYSLHWGAHLSTTKNLAIITSLIGTVSGFKFAQRAWFLWFARDHVSRRPIGAGRWGVDFFQFIISLAMAAFFIPLIIGSSVNPGDPRIVAMALPCTMLVLTLPLLITALLPYCVRLPWRVSSFPPHQPLPPLGYCYVEDVVAVDGGGCTEFRQAWRTRYEESQVIRRLIRQLSLAWGASGLLVGAGLLAACWVATVDTGYGLGCGVPWLWALLMGGATIARVHAELQRERREWTANAEGVHHARRLRIREGKYDPPALPTHVSEGVRRDLEVRRTLDWQEADADEARRALSDHGRRWVSHNRALPEVAKPESAMTRSRESMGALGTSRVDTGSAG